MSILPLQRATDVCGLICVREKTTYFACFNSILIRNCEEENVNRRTYVYKRVQSVIIDYLDFMV